MRLSVLVLRFVCAPLWGAEPDPFAGVEASTAAPAPPGISSLGGENFGWRWELMGQLGAEEGRRPASRQSAGFELLKKFSSETATRAAVDFQGRLVRRDRRVAFPNDAEGLHRDDWEFEWHNAYADVYSLAGPPGAVNARAGRFYLPLGLNLQTDTHGTLLQLSNERSLGYERDWYAGLWGALGERASYDVYYMAGSGYEPEWRGQSGLGAARVSLSPSWLYEHGLEGGVAFLGGERLDMMKMPLATTRAGLDARLRRPGPGGSWTWTSEAAGGRDGSDGVFTQLHQLDFLRGSRRWGLSAQYWRKRLGAGGDSSIIGEARWYLRNDPASSSLHWLALAVEHRLERPAAQGAHVGTLQYYRYW